MKEINEILKQYKLQLILKTKEKKLLATYFDYKVNNAIKVICNAISGAGSGDNPYKVDLTLTNGSEKDFDGIINFVLQSDKEDAKMFLPAFMYNHNRGEKDLYFMRSKYPQLSKTSTHLPYSDYWSVRADRLSHPVALMYYDNTVAGISGSPYYNNQFNEFQFFEGKKVEFTQFNGFNCSIKNNASVGFTLGYENAPYNYILTPRYDKRTKLKNNTILLRQNQSLKITLIIYCFKATKESAIGDVVQNVYNIYHEPPKKINSLNSATKDISNAIYKDSYFAEYKNYATTVKLIKGEIKKEINISIGWTGGVEIATPLLMAGLRLQDDNMRQQALNCIQNIVDNSFNDNAKLPNDAYDCDTWSSRGWWAYGIKVKGLTSYVLGQAIYYILKAYEYEKNIKNISHEDWLEFCKKSLVTMSSSITKDGEFPYIFSERNGKGIEYDSYAGCWCFASMVYYQKLSEEKIFEKHFEKCDSFYYSFIEKYECYGTPLDTYKAVDSEGVLAYIKAAKLLHEIYGKECHLTKLLKALKYEFSFKFCYNVPIQVDPLKKLNWSSAGGSVTSTCNPHIHPMSNNVIDEMLYFVKCTKDDYVASRLQDTIWWGLQSYNNCDMEQDFGLKGWMSERFCHSEGLLIEKYPNGKKSSVWFTFLPWGASNVLEGMTGDLWQEKEGYISETERTIINR